MEVAGGFAMPIQTVFAVYGGSALIALVLLHFFRARHWYWHVLSAMVAMVAGLVPMPPAWHVPNIDLAVGAVFTFLFLWGICAPLFPNDQGHHGHRHAPPHHA
jgi:hypothetical protein